MAHVVTEYSKNKKNKKSGKFPDLTATHNALRRSNKSHSEVITLPSPASSRTGRLDIVFCQLPFGCRSIKKRRENKSFQFLACQLLATCCLLFAVTKSYFFSPQTRVILSYSLTIPNIFIDFCLLYMEYLKKKEQEKQSFVRLIIFRGKKTELSLFVFYRIYRVFGSSAYFANSFQVVFLKFVVL